jgi:transposase
VLTLSGWTSDQIAEAFGVREATVRFWRSAFRTGGIEALKTAVAPGPVPVKAACALAVAEEVLSGPVADRPNGTLPRGADELEKRSGMRISRSRLSVVLRQKGISAGDGPATRRRAARTRWTGRACAGRCSRLRPRRATSCFCSRTSLKPLLIRTWRTSGPRKGLICAFRHRAKAPR